MNAPQPSEGEARRHSLPAALIHDLRTPLNHIIGYTELLLEQAQAQERQDFVADLKKTQSAGRAMLKLINESFQPGVRPEARLPVAMAEAEAPPTESAADWFPEELARTATHGSVLVVDDIEANRDVLSRRLERQGYTVTSVENGRLALARLAAQTFDLVLLDIMMPEMDGYEVLRLMKADPSLLHIPVIMISAVGEMDSVVRCIELGADDYLPKPFNQVLLKARIGACLEKKRVHDREAHLFEQLEKSYQRLQELEKGRDDITHMIVHDLRTPLNAMIMGLQELRYLGDLDTCQQEAIDTTKRGGDTLIGMINDLLDVNKMESGAIRLSRHEIHIPEMIDNAVKQVATLAAAKKLTLAISLSPDLPKLFADEGKLVRTLVNLLGNAIKFTPPGGRVTVSVCAQGEGAALQFSVVDTGEGVPSEAFVRIFEKFGQVESPEGGRTMSTGLGLTFCKLAVEAHGGHIDVESAPGEGSHFRFTIPLPASLHAV